MSPRRTRATAVGVLAGAAALLATGATPPVAANPLEEDGVDSGHLQYDLVISGHTLCSSCAVSQGGMVTAWQRFLYADGFLANCGSTGVDGYYGGVTAFANGAWEASRWAPAASNGTVTSTNWDWVGLRSLPQADGRYRYSGDDRAVWLSRYGSGAGAPFKIDLGSGGTHPTDHPSRGSYPYC